MLSTLSHLDPLVSDFTHLEGQMVSTAKRSVLGSSREILLKGAVLKPERFELSAVKDRTVTAEVVTKNGLVVNAVMSFQIW